MIVKNEESNLKRCLDSVCDMVDEMIIVDTGSTDTTIEIAQSYGAKVFQFEWTGSFSEARNHALRQASGDWIFLMDADDELEPGGQTAVLELAQESAADAYFFETISYVGERPGADVLKNMNLRLMRNFKSYFFSNAIHEQIYCNIKAVDPAAKIMNLDIKVYHYGYLTKNIVEHDKRARNISMLEKELERNPDFSFTLFNLGSEYYALGDNLKAIDYFEKAYRAFNPKEGFSSHLILKMAHCYCALGRYEESFKICCNGLAHYPFFTDLEYMKGVLRMATGKQLLAIEHFKKCCDMGETPNPYNVIIGTGTFRAQHMLGQLCFDLEDFASAADWFRRAFLECRDYTVAFLMFLKSLCKAKLQSEVLQSEIEALLKNSPDAMDIRAIDLLTAEKAYETALFYIQRLTEKGDSSPALVYYKGLCQLSQKQYETAYKTFGSLKKKPDFAVRVTCMQALCCVSLDQIDSAHKLIERTLKHHADHPQLLVFRAFLSLLKTSTTQVLEDDIAISGKFIPTIFEILKMLLHTQQFALFEKALYLLNTITNTNVLLDLAKLYYNEGCFGLAYKEFIRSIKLYEVIDTDGAKMLSTLKAMGF